MNVEISKRFLKDLSGIPSNQRSKIEDFVFNLLPSATSVYDIGVIEKMKGFKNFYKVRFGDYRLGIQLVKEKLIVERILHRKEIYRHFP